MFNNEEQNRTGMNDTLLWCLHGGRNFPETRCAEFNNADGGKGEMESAPAVRELHSLQTNFVRTINKRTPRWNAWKNWNINGGKRNEEGKRSFSEMGTTVPTKSTFRSSKPLCAWQVFLSLKISWNSIYKNSVF